MLRDYRRAGLPAAEVALLEFVETLTVAPFEIDAASWQRLQDHGWRDAEIARAAVGSAHFNYLNRMADGLGIRLDYPVHGEHQRPAPVSRPARGRARPAPRRSRASEAATMPRVRRPSTRALAGIELRSAHGVRWRAYPRRHGSAAAALRARLAIYASALAYCPTSLRWARARAEHLGVASAQLDQLASGVPVPHDHREELLFAQARTLTLEPWAASEEHVVGLRGAGLADRDIVQLTMLIAYLAFEHRVVLALGA
ncbi:MAG: hypothetical protein U1E76_25385 [Planctomycetota bacterium]